MLETYIYPALNTILVAIATALGGLLVAYINKKKKALELEIDDTIINNYLDMVAETITDCVASTTQTFVEALKKDNAFTKEKQEEAFNQSLKNVKTILGHDCLDFLATLTNDVDAYLKNKIEAEVRIQKNA